MTDIDERDERKIRRRQTVKVVILLVVLGLVVAFALVNRDSVDVDYLFEEGSAPLWMVIAGSVLAGVIIGAVAKRGD